MPQNTFDDKSTVIQVMTRAKPLPESILTQIFIGLYPPEATMGKPGSGEVAA